MANIIDGKAVSAQVKEDIRLEVEALKEQGIRIGLAVVIVGDDPASQVYVRNKEKACEAVGFESFKYALPAETTEEEERQLRKFLCTSQSQDARFDEIRATLSFLNVCKNLLHGCLGLICDDLGTCGVIAVFSGIGNRIPHALEA